MAHSQLDLFKYLVYQNSHPWLIGFLITSGLFGRIDIALYLHHRNRKSYRNRKL